MLLERIRRSPPERMRQRLRIDGGAVRQLQLREQPLQLQRHALLARPVPAGLVLPRIELPPELRGVVQRLQQRVHVAGRALVEEANVVAATLVEVGTAEFARQLADLAFHDGELVRVHKLQLPRLGTGLQPIEVGPRDGRFAVRGRFPQHRVPVFASQPPRGHPIDVIRGLLAHPSDARRVGQEVRRPSYTCLTVLRICEYVGWVCAQQTASSSGSARAPARRIGATFRISWCDAEHRVRSRADFIRPG